MRIALFSWESLHSIAVGGVAPHVTELAAALQRAGNEVHVFTRMGNGQQHYEAIAGVQYHRCPYDWNPNFMMEMNNMCRSFAYHFFQIENVSGTFDIIHGHDWMTVNALAEKWIYNFEDWKIAMIPNGVSLQKFNGFIDPWSVKKWHSVGVLDPVCLFVGRMVVQKGADLLLEAIPSVLAEFPNAKFFFIGDGYMRSDLEHRAWELGVHHACRFLGYVMDGELVNFYKACDMVCIPSRNEPFGMVALEAWAAEKPIVVTHNGFDYVWHDVNGLKVYANPNSIAWGIKSTFSNFVRARWIGSNGRKTTEGFFGDNIAKMTMGVYEEIMGWSKT